MRVTTRDKVSSVAREAAAETEQTKRRSVIVAYELSHPRTLEAEAIHIFREVAATFEHLVLLFSGGKDSAVMLHVAARVLWPAPLPFPVMHVDTGHTLPEVIPCRDRTMERLGVRLVVASVRDDIDAGSVVEDRGPKALLGL